MKIFLLLFSIVLFSCARPRVGIDDGSSVLTAKVGKSCVGDDGKSYSHNFVSVDSDGTYTCVDGKWVAGNRTTKLGVATTSTKPTTPSSSSKSCKGDDGKSYSNGFVSEDYDGVYTCVNGSWVSGKKSSSTSVASTTPKTNTPSSSSKSCKGDDGKSYSNGFVSEDYDGVYTCVNGSWVSGKKTSTTSATATSSSSKSCRGDDGKSYSNGFVSNDYDGTYTCVNGNWVSGVPSSSSNYSNYTTASSGASSCRGDDGASYSNGFVSNDSDGV